MDYIQPPNKQHYYEQAWQAARKIPHGKVASYGQIAKMIPQPEGCSDEDFKMSAARWVGMAMSACPDDVPWHRVVNAQGMISHQKQAGLQQQRLEEEGVLFSNDKISLRQYQWSGKAKGEEPEQASLF